MVHAGLIHILGYGTFNHVSAKFSPNASQHVRWNRPVGGDFMKVGVIGAGISGLSLVEALADSPVDVVAFEKQEEPGGIMRSRKQDGRVLELGPQRLRYTPLIRELVEDLGLEEQLYFGADDPLYVYVDGKQSVVPLSLSETIRTDLVSFTGKLRMLLEPFMGGPRPGESVESYLSRAFGHEAATRFLGPLYTSLYGTHPDEMPVEYSLARALETAGVDGSILLWALRKRLGGREIPEICTFEDGLGVVTQGLYEANADRIQLGTAVTAVRSAGDQFELVTTGEDVTVDQVVMTPPAPTAADILESVAPATASTLREFAYNPIAMVYCQAESDEPGVGTIVPAGEDLPISGCTWNASFLDRDDLVTCYVDPSSLPGMESMGDDDIQARATEGLETILDTEVHPLAVHRWDPGMPAYDYSFTALDDLTTPEGVHLCANYVERAGVPGRIRQARSLASELVDQTERKSGSDD